MKPFEDAVRNSLSKKLQATYRCYDYQGCARFLQDGLPVPAEQTTNRPRQRERWDVIHS